MCLIKHRNVHPSMGGGGGGGDELGLLKSHGPIITVTTTMGSRRDHEQGGGAGLQKLDFFRFKLFLNSSAKLQWAILSLWLCLAQQLKEQLRSALVAAQWQGDTALTFPLFWWWSTVSPVFFGRYPRSSLHSLIGPFTPPVPIPNKQPHFCGRKAIWSRIIIEQFFLLPELRCFVCSLWCFGGGGGDLNCSDNRPQDNGKGGGGGLNCSITYFFLCV